MDYHQLKREETLDQIKKLSTSSILFTSHLQQLLDILSLPSLISTSNSASNSVALNFKILKHLKQILAFFHLNLCPKARNKPYKALRLALTLSKYAEYEEMLLNIMRNVPRLIFFGDTNGDENEMEQIEPSANVISGKFGVLGEVEDDQGSEFVRRRYPSYEEGNAVAELLQCHFYDDEVLNGFVDLLTENRKGSVQQVDLNQPLQNQTKYRQRMEFFSNYLETKIQSLATVIHGDDLEVNKDVVFAQGFFSNVFPASLTRNNQEATDQTTESVLIQVITKETFGNKRISNMIFHELYNFNKKSTDIFTNNFLGISLYNDLVCIVHANLHFKSLHNLMHIKHRKLDLKHLLVIFRDVSHALCDLHQLGFSHNNVTTHSILVGQTEENKLSIKLSNFDFYINEHVNFRKMPWESCIYYAPEVLNSRERGSIISSQSDVFYAFSSAADVYSFGVSLFEGLLYVSGMNEMPFHREMEGLLKSKSKNPLRKLGLVFCSLVQNQVRPNLKAVLKASKRNDEVKALAQLSEACWAAREWKRPPMEEISSNVSNILRNCLYKEPQVMSEVDLKQSLFDAAGFSFRNSSSSLKQTQPDINPDGLTKQQVFSTIESFLKVVDPGRTKMSGQIAAKFMKLPLSDLNDIFVEKYNKSLPGFTSSSSSKNTSKSADLRTAHSYSSELDMIKKTKSKSEDLTLRRKGRNHVKQSYFDSNNSIKTLKSIRSFTSVRSNKSAGSNGSTLSRMKRAGKLKKLVDLSVTTLKRRGKNKKSMNPLFLPDVIELTEVKRRDSERLLFDEVAHRLNQQSFRRFRNFSKESKDLDEKEIANYETEDDSEDFSLLDEEIETSKPTPSELEDAIIEDLL